MNILNYNFRYYDKELDRMVYSTEYLNLETFFRCASMYAYNSDVMISYSRTDKNGVEIYEGDTLGSYNDDPDKGDIWTYTDVEFTTLQYINGEFIFDNWEPNFDTEIETIYNQQFISVVGNRYQGIKY